MEWSKKIIDKRYFAFEMISTDELYMIWPGLELTLKSVRKSVLVLGFVFLRE